MEYTKIDEQNIKETKQVETNYDIATIKREIELLDAETSWGVDAVNPSNTLIALTKKLFAALRMYLDGNRKKIEDELIYNQGSAENPDDFSKEVIKAIEEIKEFLKPHLL